jgi:hypothetical protein
MASVRLVIPSLMAAFARGGLRGSRRQVMDKYGAAAVFASEEEIADLAGAAASQMLALIEAGWLRRCCISWIQVTDAPHACPQ